jgi:hypothetical protein
MKDDMKWMNAKHKRVDDTVLLSGGDDGLVLLWHLRLKSVKYGIRDERPARLTEGRLRSACMDKRPWRLYRGHRSAIVSLDLCTELSLCVSCSSGLALLHQFDGDGVLRRFRPQSATGESDCDARPLLSLSRCRAAMCFQTPR